MGERDYVMQPLWKYQRDRESRDELRKLRPHIATAKVIELQLEVPNDAGQYIAPRYDRAAYTALCLAASEMLPAILERAIALTEERCKEERAGAVAALKEQMRAITQQIEDDINADGGR